MSKRKYTKEFKQEAVKLVLEQGLTASQASSDLGIKVTTLHTWLKKAKNGTLDPLSPANMDIDEMKRLRKEVAVLKQERDILKKATAFFAKLSN